MCKRSRVRCNCLDRWLLDGSDYLYACGHPDGNLIDFFAGKLLIIGLDIEEVFLEEPERFSTFKRLTNWCVKNEGSMGLSQEEAIQWLEEIRDLRKLDSGELGMTERQREEWREIREGERLRYAEFDEDPPTVLERLVDAETLCRACVKTGNPIEFY
jgi:hypothetical protein